MITSVNEEVFRIDSGSEELAAVLRIASSAAPLLVFAHGFAGSKEENGLFVDAADFFLERGYSTLRFDFRACGSNSGSFRTVRITDLVADLKSVFSFIREQQELRSCPIGFVGFSLGAGIGVLANPKVKAHAFWSPAIYTETDMFPRYNTTDLIREQERYGFILKGRTEVGLGFIQDLRQNNISQQLHRLAAPVLFVHGDADERIPWESSRQACHSVKRGAFKCIPSGDHSFRRSAQARAYLFSATLAFFEKHLHSKSVKRPFQYSFNGTWDGGEVG